MRLWSVSPSYLDRQGLLGLWRESLLAQKVLLGKTRGYQHHPQLTRFRAARNPLGAICSYLEHVACEAESRGYRFNRNLIHQHSNDERLPVSDGQLLYELDHLKTKLTKRDPDRLDQLAGIRSPQPHPTFFPVLGGIEAWERTHLVSTTKEDIKSAMPVHEITTRIQLDLPRKEVFALFAKAENLVHITPPQLEFTFLTDIPIEMRRGARIDYRLKLFRIPIIWQTLITRWEPPYQFVDEQIKGPYAMWVHQHTFHKDGKTTIVEDKVNYRLPFSPLGEIAAPLVRRQLDHIFRHREQAVRSILRPGKID
jgi:ligand-binding SRPBCC domain-containing protein